MITVFLRKLTLSKIVIKIITSIRKGELNLEVSSNNFSHRNFNNESVLHILYIITDIIYVFCCCCYLELKVTADQNY